MIARRWLLVTLTWLLACMVWAGPDPAQLAWLDRQPPVRHWDNVEGAPVWLGGAEPRYNRRHGMHLVALPPGESVQLRVAAGVQLRLMSPEGELHPADLALAWSNGSGLFISRPLQPSPAGDALQARADPDTAGVVHISRPATASGTLALALFVSRGAPPVSAASYREPVAIPQLPRVRLSARGDSENYWQLGAGQSATLTLHGATRIRLVSRFAFPATGESTQQRYRITTRLDGRPWQVLEFETALDGGEPLSVNACVTPVGRQMNGYLDIPGGEHRLELHSNAPVYIRLLAQSRPDDYLWDGNRSRHQAAMQQGHGVVGSIWDLHGNDVSRALEAGAMPWPERYRSLLRLLEDNGWRDGGLLGSALASSWAQRYADDPAMRRLATQVRKQHTRYRDLFPAELPTPQAQQYAWFRNPVPDPSAGATVVPANYAGAIAAGMAGGYFHTLPSGKTRRYTYRLPERAAASFVRLVMLPTGSAPPARFFLQYDDQPPRELQLRERAALPPGDWRAGRATAAVAAMDAAHGTRGLTLAGPFATRHAPAPLVDAGQIELALPREVRRIHVWREAQPDVPLRLALQYRASHEYRLQGTAYLALLQAPGPESVYRQWVSALANGPQGAETAPDGSRIPGLTGAELQAEARDLYNQWLPLLRLLHSRQQRFVAGTGVASDEASSAGKAVTADIRSLQEAARRARQAGDLAAALEAWTALWHGSTGTLREQAALERIRLLEQLGEDYLAEQQLRRYLVDETSKTLRARALAQLLARYRRAGDDEARLSVLATAVIRDPAPAGLRDLAQVLLDLGRTRDALQVALALPPAERPRDLLLQASYLTGWWTLFDRQLANTTDTEVYHRWIGLREQAHGNAAKAMDTWADAGEAGARLRSHLAEGLAIRAGLDAEDAEVRRQAVQRWEAWQARHPGPRRWQDVPELVARHAGAETLHAIELDRTFTAFRATPDAPLTLRIHGPARLRIKARAVHDAGDTLATDDWLQLSDGDRQAWFPLTGNRPAHGLQLIGSEPHSLPGMAERFEYRVAPGLHEIHIAPEHGPMLLQPALQRPRLPLSILPPLVPATARAALLGELGTAAGRAGAPADPADAEAITVVQQCGTSTLVMDRHRDGIHNLLATHAAPASSIHNGRQQPPATGSPQAGRLYHTISQDETLSGIALQHGLDYHQLAELNGIEPPYRIRSGQRLRIDHGDLLAGQGQADAQVIARMREILWLAEHDEGQTGAMLAAGETLFRQHPDVPGLQRLLHRLQHNTAWEPVPGVISSAGIQVVEVAYGQTEHPALRTRRALLPGLQAGEQLLSGYQTLVFAVDQPMSGQFHIDLAMEDLLAVPAPPMQVAVQVDDGEEARIRLTPARTRYTLTREVPPGGHVVRVRIVDPVLNQYLRVLVRENGGVADGTITTRPARRTYHVATPGEPVTVYLEGPTRLRIDELHDGYTTHRYRDVAAGWQRVRLQANPGRDRSLLRIHRLVSATRTAEIPARQPGREPLAVPLPTAVPADAIPVRERPAIDRFPPGGQEDGSWSLQTSLVRRRNIDEDSEADDEAEKFAELMATHRYFARDAGTWLRTDLLTRLREEGDPTLGLRARADIRPADWPVDIRLGASLYTQQPDDETGREWAATLRGSVSRWFEITPKTAHRPLIRLFQRWLSLDEIDGQHPERVDQDLFTDYKHDHSRGLGFGDTLRHRPWRDSVWHSGLNLMSNEDLNPFDPDHVELRLGARQLLGDWEASAGYSGRRYFDDDDRDGTSTRHRYQLGLDWLGWRSDRHGWQGRIQLDWDDASSEFSGLLSIAWIHGNGRFYRDFRPAETGFRSLRERRLREQRFTPDGESGDGD